MEAQYSHEIRVPKDRLAVLIGKKGEVKRDLEKRTKAALNVDSKESIVTVSGNDALSVFVAREIIKAISRGFSPDTALLLLTIDNVFEIIDISEYVKSKNHLDRVRGRVIGTDGRTRTYIEELTETHISVYGKTVSIIGIAEYVSVARKAIESLLQGSPHSNVYRWLEKQRKLLKRREFEEDVSEHVKDHVKKDLKDVRSMALEPADEDKK